MRSAKGASRAIVFSAVGLLGAGVQTGVLALLTGGVALPYLLATALAVEAAVLHNFVWHERHTWRDRTQRRDPVRVAAPRRGFGGESFPPTEKGETMVRLKRFHLANGTLSMAGNLLMTGALVECGVPLLGANGIAIVACWALNFFAADRLVFRPPEPRQPPAEARLSMSSNVRWAKGANASAAVAASASPRPTVGSRRSGLSDQSSSRTKRNGKSRRKWFFKPLYRKTAALSR